MREIFFPIAKYTRERAARITNRISRRRNLHTVADMTLFPLRRGAAVERIETQANGRPLRITEVPLGGFVAFVRQPCTAK